MSDIERRLRDLGERVRDEQDSDFPSPSMKGRIRARRFSTVAVVSLLLIAVVAAGTVAAGWVGRSSIPPAAGGPYSVEVPAEVWVMGEEEFTEAPALNLAWGRDSDTAETLACIVGLPLKTSRVELVHEQTGNVLSWDDNFAAEGDFAAVCAHNLDAEVLVEVANDPSAHRLVIDGDLEIQLVRTWTTPTSEPTATECDSRVDFEPTYLPEGWSGDLQRGPGQGGRAYPGLLGHYGGSEIGYYELVGGSSPLAQSNKREIEVLGRPATSGNIHEGLSVEFEHDGCTYALIAYVFDRAELERFAEGLRIKESGEAPALNEENFGAIWPEDIEERAGEECTSIQHVDGHWRSDGIRTAERFATAVLGWEEAQATQSKREGGIYVYVGNGPISGDTPTVIAYVEEMFGGCWSVITVGRLPEEEPEDDGSMTVRGRDVQMNFDLDGATSAIFEVGYSGQTTRYVWEEGNSAVAFTLDFEPRGTGHFLVLLRDESGKVFSAFGSPLPEGDFSAG